MKCYTFQMSLFTVKDPSYANTIVNIVPGHM